MTALEPEAADVLRYPPYVLSPADRRRWDLCEAIGKRFVELYEPAEDPQFVFYYTRYLYHSALPTAGDADGAGLTEAEEALPDPQAAARERHAWAMWNELERTKPGNEIEDPDVHWAHVARVADLFDELFGNPDELDFGDFEGRVGPDDEIKLSEAFEHVAALPYRSDLHPRDRLGKWAMKMNALRAFTSQHRDRVRTHLASAAAAAELKRDLAKAHKPGGALHADVKHAHGRGAPELQHRAHASEERGREGVEGQRRKIEDAGEKARFHAKHHAVTALAYLYSDKAERKLGPYSEAAKEGQAAVDTIEQARMTKDAAHEAAKWAVENHETIRKISSAATHIALGVGRAHGLVHADDESEQEPEPRLALAEALVEVLLAEPEPAE